MRELVYYIASTLDGFIAHGDGSLDGFSRAEDYGNYLLKHFPETFPVHLRGGDFAREDNCRFDTVLMGRKTYEVGLAEGITCPYPTLDQYVFSKTMKTSPDNHVELVEDDAISTVKALKQKESRAIWLCGGAELATTLFSAALIDRLIVKLNPVLFGSGIPLFHGSIDQTNLAYIESKTFSSGHVIVQYRVQR